jgi:hypothetical protein
MTLCAWDYDILISQVRKLTIRKVQKVLLKPAISGGASIEPRHRSTQFGHATVVFTGSFPIILGILSTQDYIDL